MTTPSLLSSLLTPSVSSARAAGTSNAWLEGGSEDGPGSATFLRAFNQARQAATALAEPPRPAVPDAARAPGRETTRETVRETVREPVREAAREPVREPTRERVREGTRSPERPGDSERNRASSQARRSEDGDEGAADRHREAAQTPESRTAPADARRAAAATRRAAGPNESSGSAAEAAEAASDSESTPVRGRKAAGRARQGAGDVDPVGAEPTAAGGRDAALAAAGTTGATRADTDTGARGNGPADATDAARGQPGWRAPIDATTESGMPRFAATGNRTGLSGVDGASADLSADAGTPHSRSGGRTGSSGRAGENATGAIDFQALGLRATQGDASVSTFTAEALGEAGALAGAGASGSTTPGIAAGTLPGALGSLMGTAGAAGPTGAGAAAEPSSLRDAGLAAPPGSEAFARELGAQVTLFVREGVQQARLHLNPQDLGPVLVQIQLDGHAAHVQFSAEMQPTRDALQQALPTLAGQLSEAGLTLAGGGVFERPPQEPGGRGTDEAGARASSRADGHAAEPGTTPLPGQDSLWSRPRGLVDLMA